MREKLLPLSIPYPDFKLNEIIDPDQFDLNNASVVDKINKLVVFLNELIGVSETGQSGATLISFTQQEGFTSENVQDMIKEVVTRINVHKQELIDALEAKTNVNGNHQGTWQGLLPLDLNAGQQALDLSNLTSRVNVLEGDFNEKLYNYNRHSYNKDDNGIFLTVDYTRDNDTLYMQTIFSNPNENQQYQTLTAYYYNEEGTDVIRTVVWLLEYDEDGDITKWVRS